jgi:uncharacterized protein YcaQ
MVLDRIRREGPLGSADFKEPSNRRGTWWEWKPAKSALETLHATGVVMVSKRRNFHRIFDLAERVLPPGTDTTEPGRDEVARFAIRRALNAHGIATAREIRNHIWIAKQAEIDAALAEMVEAREVERVAIKGIPDQEYFALPATLTSEPSPTRTRQVHLLSPFDNLVIQRERTRRLFDFDYQLECYKPAPQRTHGYFVLPVLYGTQFIARLDPKVDRKTKTLHIRRLAFEFGVKPNGSMLSALAKALRNFAAFNGAQEVVLARVDPAAAKPQIEKLLAD